MIVTVKYLTTLNVETYKKSKIFQYLGEKNSRQRNHTTIVITTATTTTTAIFTVQSDQEGGNINTFQTGSRLDEFLRFFGF